MYRGIIHLTLWGYIDLTLLLTHISVVAVTLFLHRSQAHRSLSLHPAVSHIFRFWLWLTTGIITKEWVAVHRKHHTCSDLEGDPHSPRQFGIKRVFFGGAFLYRTACRDMEIIERYGNATPDDWLERNIYTRNNIGIFLMLAINLVLFGFVGLFIWIVQMLWMPLMSAGVINGLAHYWGYRNFECTDDATNLIPWDILFGGEVLHNNHHAFSTSAKFSSKWWELDIGWIYIWMLFKLGLAKPKRLIPQMSWLQSGKIDLATVHALLVNRLHVMNKYARQVLLPVLHEEKIKAGSQKCLFKRKLKKLLLSTRSRMSERQRHDLMKLLELNPRLKTVYQLRLQLQEIWEQTRQNREELLKRLQQWCSIAEKTDITFLLAFVNDIKRLSCSTS